MLKGLLSSSQQLLLLHKHDITPDTPYNPSVSKCLRHIQRLFAASYIDIRTQLTALMFPSKFAPVVAEDPTPAQLLLLKEIRTQRPITMMFPRLVSLSSPTPPLPPYPPPRLVRSERPTSTQNKATTSHQARSTPREVRNPAPPLPLIHPSSKLAGLYFFDTQGNNGFTELLPSPDAGLERTPQKTHTQASPVDNPHIGHHSSLSHNPAISGVSTSFGQQDKLPIYPPRPARCERSAPLRDRPVTFRQVQSTLRGFLIPAPSSPLIHSSSKPTGLYFFDTHGNNGFTELLSSPVAAPARALQDTHARISPMDILHIGQHSSLSLSLSGTRRLNFLRSTGNNSANSVTKTTHIRVSKSTSTYPGELLGRSARRRLTEACTGTRHLALRSQQGLTLLPY